MQTLLSLAVNSFPEMSEAVFPISLTKTGKRKGIDIVTIFLSGENLAVRNAGYRTRLLSTCNSKKSHLYTTREISGA